MTRRRKKKNDFPTFRFLNNFQGFIFALVLLNFPIKDNLVKIINNCFFVETFLSMILLSADRVLAIKHHFAYLKVRTKHIVGIVVFVWLLGACFFALLFEVRAFGDFIQ